MPSQQEIRAAFSRLISPLKVADEVFKFHQDLIVSQTFETQKVSDDKVLKYFQQTEEKIHSMDTRKQLKFPDKAPPSKTNAINSGDGAPKSKGKGNQKSQSVPPAENEQTEGISTEEGGEGNRKGIGRENQNPSRLPRLNLLQPFHKPSHGKARGRKFCKQN